MDASSSSLEGSVAAVLSEVLNINGDNTALAKRVVAAARKGTIESFAVVCASFGAYACVCACVCLYACRLESCVYTIKRAY